MPVLETAKDRDNEVLFDGHIEAHLGWHLKPLPQFHPMDRVIIGGEPHTLIDPIVGWLEYKTRTRHFRAYPSVMISLAKVLTGVGYSERTGLPYWLGVSFPSPNNPDAREYYMAKVTGETISQNDVALSGRYDRGLEEDIVPQLFIHNHYFHRIGVSNGR
jgi:hypothetical protein